MSAPVESGELHGGANGTTEAARADETVSHGRAHLDYQRKVATADIHRNHLNAVTAPQWGILLPEIPPADGTPYRFGHGGNDAA